MMQSDINENLDHNVPRGQRTHWRDYARIFWERKWIAITTLVIAVTFQLIANFKAVPIYQASAKIELGAETAKLPDFQNLVAAGGPGFDNVGTQLRILQSWSLADKVVKGLGLHQNRDFMPAADENADFAGEVQKCLTVQQMRGTRILDITAAHTNPKIAALIANGVASEFIKRNLERKMTASLEAIQWLGEQAIDYKKQLEQSDAAVQEYREKANFAAMEEGPNIMFNKVMTLSAALSKAKTDRMEAEAAWNETKSLLDAGKSTVSVSVIASSPEVSAWRAQLAGKEIAVSALRERYKDKYPAMVVALKEKKEIEEALNKACAAAAERLKETHLAAKAREADLDRAVAEAEKLALEMGRKLLSFNVVKRNADLDRQLYDTIMMRMKEAGIAGKLELNDIRMLDMARTPDFPSKPDKPRDLLIALVLGLMAGLGLSYGAHMYDDKIRTQADINSHLGLPLLCEVPRIELADGKQRATITLVEPRSIAGEAFLNLRATLNVLTNSKDIRVLLVTSTAPGEGKSLVASNLAIAFARDNQRTLLIDGDLRHPSISEDFAIPGEPGLIRYLTNGATPEDVVCKTEVPNLDVVVAGKIAHNPAELLGSAKMRALLDEASRRYDRVVIDSSPVAVVSDPIVLLPRVQGVVFVTQFSKIRRDTVARSVRKLRESGAPLIGVVLNNIDLKKHGYFFPYRHSHYYYPKKGESRRSEDGNSEESQELDAQRKA